MFIVQTIYVLVLFITVVENCSHPCKCETFTKKISCSDSPVEQYEPLKSIPVVNYSIKWEELEISNQPIVNITRNEFQIAGLRTLRYISMRACELTTIHEEAFNNLTNLHSLNLSYNKIRKLHERTFKPIKNIQFLTLNHNRLEAINDKLFADLTFLQNLEITNNNLAVFSTNALQNNLKLKQLHLSDNKLTTLNMSVINSLPNLNTLKIINNQWTCDCLLKDVYDYMIRRNFKEELTNNICNAPDNLKDQSWKNITREDLQCWLRVSVHSKKEEAKYNEQSLLCCQVDSNTRPIDITWKFKDEIINTSTKYNFSIQPTHNQIIYWYKLNIFNLTDADKGTYQCIFNNGSYEESKEIILDVEPQQFDAYYTIVVVMIVFCIVCCILIIFKCVIRCHIVKNTNEDQLHYQETSKVDNDDISIHSLKSDA